MVNVDLSGLLALAVAGTLILFLVSAGLVAVLLWGSGDWFAWYVGGVLVVSLAAGIVIEFLAG